MDSSNTGVFHSLPMRRILRAWWPLAGSWLLMAVELPAVSAVIARLANPEINLAAYGGIVSPLALLIESPILMLLSASTALSKDWASYRKIWKFMMIISAALTVLHLLVALTPLYTFVVDDLLGAPKEIIEPARLGLLILTPWSWAIAYRRFHQGVLIRFGHSQAVGIGTVIRLSVDGLVLATGYIIKDFPGIVVGASAMASGVLAEAIYAGIIVRPVLQREVRLAPPVNPQLTYRAFLDFYIPLAMTSLIGLIVQPIGSAALSRMPNPLQSLAIWPVASGLIFMLRSIGIAYNEVVVTLLDEPMSAPRLRRFTFLLAEFITSILLLLAATPLSWVWFHNVSGLNNVLADLARHSIWLGAILPGLSVFQSWYQGAILHGRKTRAVTESVVIFLISNTVILSVGVLWGQIAGLYLGMASFSLSSLAQVTWLWHRSRPVIKRIHSMDIHVLGEPSAEALYLDQ
jgi:hypothetical protein